jgi:hypothetical protein
LSIGCLGEYLDLRGRTRERRKLHNEELKDMYSSPNIFLVIKLRRKRWVVHVARMRERRGFWWRNMRERDHLGDPDINGRIILRWIYRKWDWELLTGLIWPRIGTGGGQLRTH